MRQSRHRLLLLSSILGSLALGWALPDQTRAEWYAGAYGGVSLGGRITDGSLPIYGQNQAQALFPNPSPSRGDYTASTFSLNDSIKLKNSAMFGGRVGYFFNAYGYPWAGLEVEAFTTQPDIKQQTVPYTNGILSNRQIIVTPAQPQSTVVNSTVPIGESTLRVTTVALNAVVRYPGKVFQPYAGVGVGLFYFQGTSSFQGNLTFTPGDPPLKFDGNDLQPGLNTFAGMKYFFSDKVALFGEYKYNRATINRLDDVFGLKGNYSIMHVLGGVAYHF